MATPRKNRQRHYSFDRETLAGSYLMQRRGFSPICDLGFIQPNKGQEAAVCARSKKPGIRVVRHHAAK